MLLHRFVHLVLVHADDFPLDLLALPGELHDGVADIADTGAAVDQPDVVLFLHGRAVVMRRHDQVHALQALQQVQALALQDGAVALAHAGMRQHDQHVGPLLGADAVHPLLRAGDQRVEADAAPDGLRQPGLHVGIGQAEHGHFHAAAAEDLVGREIRLAVVRADGIGPQEGDAARSELGRDLVIDGVAGLDVVVAHGHGVILHVGKQRDEGMLAFRVDIIEIIGRVVALQAVAGIQQEHVLLPDGPAEAVHPGMDGHETRLGGLALDVGLVKPVAVDVARGDDVQRAVAGSAAGSQQAGHQYR